MSHIQWNGVFFATPFIHSVHSGPPFRRACVVSGCHLTSGFEEAHGFCVQECPLKQGPPAGPAGSVVDVDSGRGREREGVGRDFRLAPGLTERKQRRLTELIR